MNNANAIRSLVIFGLCVPLALFLGYILSDPISYKSFGVIGVVAFLLLFPLIMKWHYPMMVLSWNMVLSGLFFLPGSPSVWLVLMGLSLGMAIFERSLLRETRFIHVPKIWMPLFFLGAVVLITAQLTGGFGFRSLGSEVYGGKKYVYLLAAICSFAALTSRKIPPEQAKLYVGLFLLGGATNAIGDLYFITPDALQFIFWVFPPVSGLAEGNVFGILRLRGVGVGAMAVFCWMLAHYGIRGIFLSGKNWRAVLFVAISVTSFAGGFRSTLLAMVILFSIQFYLEGLHRSRLAFVITFFAILGGASVVPLASKLPHSFQRVLAIVPPEFLELKSNARLDAQVSTQWRLDMWEAVAPQVPQYLFLGKGLRITQEDFQMMAFDTSFQAFDASQQGSALAYDYHNGPLSVIIPFGIWGVIGFCWFIAAGFWALIRNFRYGDPQLKLINTFFLAYFTQKTLMFLFVYGAFSSDMVFFAGLLGLNVALNHGIRRPSAVRERVLAPHDIRPRLLSPNPSFHR